MKRIYTKRMRMMNRKYRQDHLDEIKSKQKIYGLKNRESIRLKSRLFYVKNRKRLISKQKKYYQGHRLERIAYIKKYQSKNLKENINYRLARILRTRVYHVLKGNVKNGSSVIDLGCNIVQLKQYLESKFQKGMTWKNYGLRGWHIDHIKPLIRFNLSDREEFLKAVHFSNLQPMWWKENISKGARI